MSASFTVVGCGTVVPESDSSCSAYLLKTAERLLLLDCGPGTSRSLARIGAPWGDIDDVWISHFHTDHTGGLPSLLFALEHGLLPDHRRKPLTLWGPVGTEEVVGHYAAAMGQQPEEFMFPLEFREVAPSVQVDLGSLRLSTLSTPHTEESLALRVDHEEWSVTYSGDSGPEADFGRFAGGSDLFVCECSLPDHLVGDNHLSPSSVARIANRSRPDLLLLTHVYPQFRARADVAGLVVEAGYSGRAVLAVEGWSTRLPS